MALKKFTVSFFNKGTNEHVLEIYHAENALIAAVLVVATETTFPYKDLQISKGKLDSLKDFKDKLIAHNCYVEVIELS